MAFAPSKTSAAQTAYNASATIVSALINSGAFKPEAEDVAGSVLELLGSLVAPIREDLGKLVDEDTAAAASAPSPRSGGFRPAGPGSAPSGGSGSSYGPPGAQKLTQSGKHAGKTLEQIYKDDPKYVTGLAAREGFWADDKFAKMGAKAKAYVDSLTAAAKAGEQSPDYLG